MNLTCLSSPQELSHSVIHNGKILATLSPLPDSKIPCTELPYSAETQLHLSRFCYLQNKEWGFLLETPLDSSQIKIFDPVFFKIFNALATPITIEQLSLKTKGLPKKKLIEILSLLYRASCLNVEKEPSSLATWEFHDLLFHARSRVGRHRYPFGGTYRFQGKIPSSPALRQPPNGPHILLSKPDMHQLEKTDLPFSQVMEGRKSIRKQGKVPISVQQLGEFLYRCARVKEKKYSKKTYDIASRPYAGGGACYELEVYPLVYQCQGLESGLYYYNPDSHSLCPIEPWGEKVEKLAYNAMRASNKEGLPQVLLTFSARFARVTWKYQTMAYATILKDVGSLIQSMYLVATAMQLAPCAIGAGDSDLFSKLIKTDYYEEGSVGEFILGSI